MRRVGPVLLAVFSAGAVLGATFNVTTTNDVINPGDGELSLREAIIAANTNSGPDVIELPAWTFPLTIGGANEDACLTGDLDITDTSGTCTLNGASIGATVISAAMGDRVLQCLPGNEVSLNRLTIQNGRVPMCVSHSDILNGGGILNQGDLTISSSVIKNNQAGVGDGFGLVGCEKSGSGGGVASSGNLLMVDCQVVGNQAARGYWSPTYDGPGGHGGGIYAGGTLVMERCAVVGNNAGMGGRPEDGGDGGGLFVTGTTILSNCTVSGNRAGDGGGARLSFFPAGDGGDGGGIWAVGTLALHLSTVAFNEAGRFGCGGLCCADGANGNGGGIWFNGIHATLDHTIVDQNETFYSSTNCIGNTGPSAGQGPDCLGTFESLGYNLIGNGSNCTITGSSTGLLNGVSAGLEPLQDNGGPTPTHALPFWSPAFDAGDPGFATPPVTDQRGWPRLSGARVDLGAYERLVGHDATVTKTAPSRVERGSSFDYTIVVSNHGPGIAVGVTVTDSLPAEVTFVSASPGCVFTNQSVVCTPGVLGAGMLTTLTVSVTAPDVAGVLLSNLVLVSTPTNDTGTLPNQDVWTNYVSDYVFWVTSTTPGHAALDRPGDAIIEVAFNENPVFSTVNVSNFLVRGHLTGIYTGAYDLVAADRIRFAPAKPFLPGERIRVVLGRSIASAAGSELLPYTFEFRTRSFGCPSFKYVTNDFIAGGRNVDIALGDLDGDGDQDVFIAKDQWQGNRVLINNGLGVFTDSGQVLGGSESQAVALGDLDGDGDLDAFVANYSPTATNRVWLNNGAGLFSDSGQDLTIGIGTNSSWRVELGDLDGDGDLDAMVGYLGSLGLRIWWNEGGGTFRLGSGLGGIDGYNAGLGDLDGDGDLDVFILGSGPNRIWFNDGSGQFTASGQNLGSAGSAAVDLGDLDGDGDLDAFVANWGSEPDRIWLNDGAGVFSAGQQLGAFDSRDVALGDLDGDGDLDAFVAIFSFESNKIWINDGSALFTDSGQALGWFASGSTALGDVNGDGMLDAFANPFWRANVWLQSGCENLSVVKTGDRETISTNAFLDYAIVVSNRSSVVASNVVVTDILPDFVTYQNANPLPTLQNGPTNEFAIGTLAPGQAATISIQIEVMTNAPVEITNQVWASAAWSESYLEDNYAFAATRIADTDQNGDPDFNDPDDDGDGAPDAEEDIAGTDPIDPLSFLAIHIRRMAAMNWYDLYWPSVPNRTYTIQGATNLFTGPWTNVATNIPGDGTMKSRSHSNRFEQLYYRLEVVTP